MATMLSDIDLSVCHRPVYTTFCLSEMVKNKRKEANVSEKDFAEMYGVATDVLMRIEEGTCSFSPKLYKACSSILSIPLNNLIAMEEDAVPSFRSEADNDDTRETFDLANYLLDTIIMQKKISAREYR